MSDQASTSPEGEEPDDDSDIDDEQPVSPDELLRRLVMWSAEVRQHLATLGQLREHSLGRCSSPRPQPLNSSPHHRTNE